MTIQERALESLESRKARITYGYDTFAKSHMEKVQRQLEVIEYLENLVKMDEVAKVIRYKDCKYWIKTTEQGYFGWELPEGKCMNDRYFTAWQESRAIVPANHFCADGEEKSE